MSQNTELVFLLCSIFIFCSASQYSSILCPCFIFRPLGYKYEGVKFERGNCGVSIMRSGKWGPVQHFKAFKCEDTLVCESLLLYFRACCTFPAAHSHKLKMSAWLVVFHHSMMISYNKSDRFQVTWSDFIFSHFLLSMSFKVISAVT